MTPLEKLIQSRAHKALSAKEVIERAEKENRPMVKEEVELFDKLTAEIKALDDQIKAQQDHNNRVEALNQIIVSGNQSTGRQAQPDQPTVPARPINNPFRVPGRVTSSTRSENVFRGDSRAERRETAYRVGMWAMGFVFGNERCQNWCLNHGIRNALAEGDNSKGGFWVPEEFSEAMIDLREQYGTFRQECFIQPMGRDTLVVPRRSGGVTIGPIGENPASAITQSNPTWNQVRLVAKKAGGLVLMSSEVAEDAAIDLAAYLVDEFAYAFALFEDQCGFIGDGTSTYCGINGLGNQFTTTGGAGGGQLVGAVNATSGHNTFGNCDTTDIATLMGKLPAYAKPNAKFYCSAVCDEVLFGRLLAVAGGNRIMDMEAGRVQRQYMGYPIVINQQLPTILTTLNAKPMFYFGDLRKAATLGDRRDVRVFPSEHRYMDTDQIGVRGTERFDIVIHDVGDTTTGNAGPIVALVGN